MKRIYFGRYIKRESPLHQLHPLLKFLLFLSVILMIGFHWNGTTLVYFTGLFICFLMLSRISPVEMISALKPFKWLLLITFVFQFLFTGEHFWSLDLQRLNFAILVTLRFLMLILFSALLTLCTTPLDLVRVLHFLIRPFESIGARRLGFSLSALVALRFMPILFRKSHRIFNTMKSDGAFHHKGRQVFQQLESFLILLFTDVFRYVDKVAAFLGRDHDWEQVLGMKKVKKGDTVFFIFLMAGVCGGLFV